MLAREVDTLAQLFLRRVEVTPAREAYRRKIDGRWVGTTWSALAQDVQRVAAGLLEEGLERGDRIAIIGGCRPEWVQADLGALLIGAGTVGIYENLLVDQVEYILRDAGAKLLVAQGRDQLEKLRPLLGTLPELRRIVVWDHEPGTEDPRVTTLAALMVRGAAALDGHPHRVREQAAKIAPAELATIVYTSGTTGLPKGVPLCHGTLVGWMRNTQDLLMDDIGAEDITMSFLPLAHVAEHVAGLFGRMNVGLNTAYATSYDTLLDELHEVRPTYFGAVPRIFEKMYGRILERVAQASPRRRGIFETARDLARRRARALLGGEPLTLGQRLRVALYDLLVYRRIRAVFGGRVKCFITGSAPIEIEILEFFFGVGMKIHEVYGMSETCAIIFANGKDHTRLGTVGRAVPGLEYRLESDGEILVKGTGIFDGYLNQPEENAQAFDAQGFFHTGDIGEVDADGYLRLTDRKKNLIKTAGGKYVVPARLEMLVKAEPVVGSVYIHGDQRPYVVALITLDPREAPRLAEELHVSHDHVDRLHEHPEIRRRIDQAVARANEKLARFEQIKRYALLPSDFSQEEGTLTATLKIKRKEVARRYAAEIDALYTLTEAARATT